MRCFDEWRFLFELSTPPTFHRRHYARKPQENRIVIYASFQLKGKWTYMQEEEIVHLDHLIRVDVEEDDILILEVLLQRFDELF